MIKKIRDNCRWYVVCRLIPKCDVEGVLFVDVWDHFNKDNSLYSRDGLHLNRVEKFGQVYRRRNLRVNENKNKVMKCTSVGGKSLDVVFNGEFWIQDYYRWRNRDKGEVKRINDVEKVLGGIKMFSSRVIGMNVKRRLYEGVAVLTALHGAET